MTKFQVQYRIDSRLSKILHTKFRKADFDKNDFERWENIINRLKERKKNFFEIACLPKGCCTFDIEKEMNRVQAINDKQVDILFVDYINIMSTNYRKEHSKEWQGQSEIAWDLKSLSVDFNGIGIPIWSASQITDEGAKSNKIETWHAKYSRGLSEISPVIISLNQSEDDQLESILKMWIVKCRDFEKSKQPIILHPKFNYSILNMQEIEIEKNKHV